MNSTEFRQSFLDFFKSKEHAIVSSASLMPSSPNLLFTNAGMNQFVPYFLGERAAPYNRAADTQKCIRAGGKHNDLEDVGFDTYHHTFFEMLGNWSFGDYFKQEAIEWAWELITQVWKFPKERLYATVYRPGEGDPADFDQEAYDFWKAVFEKEGLNPEKHIIFGNKKDNFWMMGDTGPCGPCSELHIDLTPKGDTEGKLVNADSPYCIEIWNLVFIQFNANADGSFQPLKDKHVDTGMGFERVAGIYATSKGFTDFSQPPSNYNCDLFTDIFAEVSKLTGKTYGGTLAESREKLSGQELIDTAFRVLADHIRTVSCAIADGILPDKDGRNYVIRRILRRAVLWANRIDMPKGSLVKLVDPVIAKLGDIFPELKQHETVIKRYVAAEEDAFNRTIDRGLQLFDKIAADTKDTISGEDAFALYDTYGFPLDLTQLVASDRGLKVDLDGFETCMEAQRQKGRDAQKKSEIKLADDSDASATKFVGYELSALDGTEAEVLEVIPTDDGAVVVLNTSPFYAEMGGQVGDTGFLKSGDVDFQVVNTTKDEAGRFLHQLPDASPALKAGDQVVAVVDKDRRLAIQRNHSATHLMHHALREVVGTHIRQAGSYVDPNRLRFDFSHFEAVSPEELREVERKVNRMIQGNAGVKWFEVPFDKKPEQVIAQFGEKYGNVVRVVDIGGYSMELCGGTHSSATGEIGFFKILHESAISAGTRRIEAAVGDASFEYVEDQVETLHQATRTLACTPAELEARLEKLISEKTRLEKELKKFQQKAAAGQAGDLANEAQDRDGLKWLVRKVEAGNPNEMRGLAVQISKEIGEGVVVLAGVFGPKITVLALCTPKAIEAGHQAGAIVKGITSQLGGSGGGKPDFAMGGAKDADKLESVLASL